MYFYKKNRSITNILILIHSININIHITYHTQSKFSHIYMLALLKICHKMLYNAMSNHLQNDNETEQKEKHTNTILYNKKIHYNYYYYSRSRSSRDRYLATTLIRDRYRYRPRHIPNKENECKNRDFPSDKNLTDFEFSLQKLQVLSNGFGPKGRGEAEREREVQHCPVPFSVSVSPPLSLSLFFCFCFSFCTSLVLCVCTFCTALAQCSAVPSLCTVSAQCHCTAITFWLHLNLN